MTSDAHTGRADYDQLVRFRSIPADEPTFLLRGQDMVGAAAVRAYVQLAKDAGAEPAFLELASAQADAMERWPVKKLPDVDLPDARRKNLAYIWERRQWNGGGLSAEAVAEQRGFERAYALLDTDDAFEIFGWVCFRCIQIANGLRAGGMQIKRRAEDEQAAVIRWMLQLLFRHGPDWREAAADELERMAGLAKAGAPAGEPAHG